MRFKKVFHPDHLLGHFERVESTKRGPYMTRRRIEEQRHIRQTCFIAFMLGFILTLIICSGIVRANEKPPFNPIPSTPVVIHSSGVEGHQGPGQVATGDRKTTTTPESNKYDLWIDKYSKKFGTKPGMYLYTKQLLHCMIYRESKYGTDKGYGDGGKAGGVMQFWQETFIGYRKLMIKAGYTDEIGSRENPEQAISTAAWAVNNGRAKAWGPVARKECQ